MLILALDSSAAPASAALLEDGKILSEFYINTKQTHSQTLMPMVESVLKLTNKTLDDVTCMAVSAGPGSFTGVRIGVSCVKGLSMTRNIPCAGVSTLPRHGGATHGAARYRLCCDGRTLRAGV